MWPASRGTVSRRTTLLTVEDRWASHITRRAVVHVSARVVGQAPAQGRMVAADRAVMTMTTSIPGQDAVEQDAAMGSAMAAAVVAVVAIIRPVVVVMVIMVVAIVFLVVAMVAAADTAP